MDPAHDWNVICDLVLPPSDRSIHGIGHANVIASRRRKPYQASVERLANANELHFRSRTYGSRRRPIAVRIGSPSQKRSYGRFELSSAVGSRV
jgi:hypothetical protein